MKSNKNRPVIIAMILSGIMAMSSCTSNKNNNNNAVVPDVSFNKDIIPIFTANCAINSSCHAGAKNTGDNIDLDSAVAYTSMGANQLINYSNPSASLIYVEVSSGTMPKVPYSALSAGKISLILNWIKQGAKNN